MALLDEIHAKRDIILKTAEECGLTNVRVFGSVARGEETDESDVDILVSRIPNASKGLRTYGFPAELEKIIARNIDFVVDSTLHWAIRDRVLKEAKPL
jgi:uncharacterized protein